MLRQFHIADRGGPVIFRVSSHGGVHGWTSYTGFLLLFLLGELDHT